MSAFAASLPHNWCLPAVTVAIGCLAPSEGIAAASSSAAQQQLPHLLPHIIPAPDPIINFCFDLVVLEHLGLGFPPLSTSERSIYCHEPPASCLA
eukprot:12172892-Prorocentrum_lima.AAC.1